MDDGAGLRRASYMDGDQRRDSHVPDTMFRGTVTIKLKDPKDAKKDHEDTIAKRLQMSSKTCTWLDEARNTILTHNFGHQLSHYYPYRDTRRHEKLSVGFEPLDMKGCEAKCRDPEHDWHRNTIPRYVFSDEVDYKEFQSNMRGKKFIRDFEAKTNSSGHGASARPNQCIKLWADARLTIPVSVPAGNTWKIEHAEISVHWMNWKKSGSKEVKADFRHAPRRPSVDDSPTASRRSSFGLGRFSNSRREIDIADGPVNENNFAPTLVQRWKDFTLEFRGATGNVRQSCILPQS